MTTSAFDRHRGGGHPPTLSRSSRLCDRDLKRVGATEDMRRKGVYRDQSGSITSGFSVIHNPTQSCKSMGYRVRLGWLAASEERLARMRMVQQYLTLTLNAITVALGAAILHNPAQFSREDLIRDNRSILSDWANRHRRVISISAPVAGTTVCLTIDTAVDEMKLFERFVQAGVLLAPGTQCFEYPQAVPWFRLGYGAESQTLNHGLELISARNRCWPALPHRT